MIEFNGYLTGNALKYFYKRYVRFLQVFSSLMCFIGIPIFFLIFSNKTRIWIILVTVISIFVIYSIFAPYLLIKLDKRRMELNKKNNVPKQVYIKEDIIVCVSSQVVENRKITDVKEVEDYGEYYALRFSIFCGYSPNFVCQKNLLIHGTLEEFEALFEGKITRKTIRGRLA